MRFISVRELNTKTKNIWGQLQEEEIVITSNGKPASFCRKNLEGLSRPFAVRRLSWPWMRCKKIL